MKHQALGTSDGSIEVICLKEELKGEEEKVGAKEVMKLFDKFL